MSGTEYNLTPKLGLYKPITNMDANNWGTHWNANADQLDRSVIYDTRGNVGISVLPPANQAPSSANVNGGWVFGWGLTANNWATNGYYDGSAWRYLANGTLWQTQQTGTQIIWQFAPTGVKDAVATLTNKMTLDSGGTLTTAGSLIVTSDATVHGSILRVNGPWAQLKLNAEGPPTDNRLVTQYIDNTSGQFTMQFANDADNAGASFFSVARSGITPTGMNLAANNINLYGNINVSVPGGGYFAVNGSDAARLEGGGGYAIWRYNNTQRRWWVGNSDLGDFVFFDESAPRTVMTLAKDGNVTVGAGIYGGYIRSFGDIKADSRLYCNDMMVSGATIYVANDYGSYIQRSGVDWLIVNQGVVNLTVSSDGWMRPRAGFIGSAMFSYGPLHWGNDWAHILGNGGNGQYMQFAPGYYWTYNNSTGDMLYVMNNANQWVIHANSSCYNDRNWTGGRGPYVDISDIRGKRDIEPATYGLREILRLEPIRFRRIRHGIDAEVVEDREEVSFSAQDVREVIPHAIFQVVPPADAAGHCGEPELGLATTPIVAALVCAVQELTARIEDLEARR